MEGIIKDAMIFFCFNILESILSKLRAVFEYITKRTYKKHFEKQVSFVLPLGNDSSIPHL